MIFVNLRRALLITGCLLACAKAQANIQVEPMTVRLNPRYTGMIAVTSKSTDAQFIQSRVVEIAYPGTAQEQENPTKPGQLNSLVVTPSKFALPAGNSQQIRLINLTSPQQEKIYRVWFQSMTPEQLHYPETATTWATDLAVTLAWGVVVMVPPATPTLAVSYRAATGEIINTGNLHIHLRRIGLCHDTACRWSSVKKNIYPGQSWNPAMVKLTPSTTGYLSLDYVDDYTGEQGTLKIALN